MVLGLTGKVALVTGAGSQVGYGKGIALTLAKNGCDIVVNDIDEQGAKATAAEIETLGRKALAIKTDVTDSSACKAMVQQALDKFGRIDILVNNAGRATARRPFVETPEEDLHLVFNLNLFGSFNCARTVLPDMLARKYGKIINISSGAGYSGTPMWIAYGASKAALMSFTKGLSKEVIKGINVNSVAPGLGDTNFLKTAGFPEGEINKALPMTPTVRTTSPEDVGNLVAYLASDISNNIVGQVVLIDGGMG